MRRTPSFFVAGDGRRLANLIKAESLSGNTNVSAELRFPDSVNLESRAEVEISSAPDQTGLAKLSADLVFSGQKQLQISRNENAGVVTDHIPASDSRKMFKILEADAVSRGAKIDTVRKVKSSLPASTSTPNPLGVRSETAIPKFSRRSTSLNVSSKAENKPDESQEVPEIEVLTRGLEETKKRIQKLAKLDWEINFLNDSDNEVYPLPISPALSPRGDDLHTQAIEPAVLTDSSRDSLLLSKPQNQARGQELELGRNIAKIDIQNQDERGLPPISEQDGGEVVTKKWSTHKSLQVAEASARLREEETVGDEFFRVKTSQDAQSNVNQESKLTIASATASERIDDKTLSQFTSEQMFEITPRSELQVSLDGSRMPPLYESDRTVASNTATAETYSPREMGVVGKKVLASPASPEDAGLVPPASPADSEPTLPPNSLREEMPASPVNTNLSSQESIEEFMKRLKEEKDRLADKPYDHDYEVFREEKIKGQRLESEKSQALDEAPSISETLYHLKVMSTMINGIIYDNHEVLPIKHSDLVPSLKAHQKTHIFDNNMVYEVNVGRLFDGSFQFYFAKSQRKAENFDSPIFLFNDIRGEISLDKDGNDVSKHKRTIIEKALGFYDPDSSRYEFTLTPIRDNLSRTALYPELNFLKFLESKKDKFSQDGNYSVAIQESNGVFDLFPMRYHDQPNSNSKILRIPTTTGVKEIDLSKLSTLIEDAKTRENERQNTLSRVSLVRVANRGSSVHTLGAQVRVVSKKILDQRPNTNALVK